MKISSARHSHRSDGDGDGDGDEAPVVFEMSDNEEENDVYDLYNDAQAQIQKASIAYTLNYKNEQAEVDFDEFQDAIGEE
jgi:hypothetical protein